MARTISERELGSDSGEIMREVEAGESFVITRNGVPVAELTPLKRGTHVPRDAVLRAFAALPHIDAASFFRDIDAVFDRGLGDF